MPVIHRGRSEPGLDFGDRFGRRQLAGWSCATWAWRSNFGGIFHVIAPSALNWSDLLT